MIKDELRELRTHLVRALSGGDSHITFEQVMKDFPAHARASKPAGAPHTAWELLEHMRIAQRDILDFSRYPKHKSPTFPDGYWPGNPAPANEKAWQEAIAGFERDRREFAALIENSDLFTPFPHGDGQNLLREAIVLANHNSYHLGEVVFLKKLLTGKA